MSKILRLKEKVVEERIEQCVALTKHGCNFLRIFGAIFEETVYHIVVRIAGHCMVVFLRFLILFRC
jgi:hypothetical protein